MGFMRVLLERIEKEPYHFLSDAKHTNVRRVLVSCADRSSKVLESDSQMSTLSGGSPSSPSSPNRLARFGDWAHVRGVQALATISFFHGEGVAERMTHFRQSIHYVRENWEDYTTLENGLKALIEREIPDDLRREGGESIESILSSPKEWRDGEVRNPAGLEDYSVIRLYASDFGYEQIFKIADTIFRTGAGVGGEEESMNSAVFLVELLNVDLFNYVSVTPAANNFQGVVYRALAASEEQLTSFQELAARPIPERYWAIPLAIMSASRDQETAMAYAKREVPQQTGSSLFLWRIHVVALEADLLQIYHDRFPASVVTTVCAVPIEELTGYPEQDEVLLRGPFFQLLRMHEEAIDGIGNVHVMDSVMLNTNRDHPSSMGLPDEARDLIGHLVGVGRARACRALAEEYGLVEDAETYRQHSVLT